MRGAMTRPQRRDTRARWRPRLRPASSWSRRCAKSTTCYKELRRSGRRTGSRRTAAGRAAVSGLVTHSRIGNGRSLCRNRKASSPPPAPTALADVPLTPVQQRGLGLLFGQPERRFQSAELIRREPPAARELQGLLASARERLADADNPALAFASRVVHPAATSRRDATQPCNDGAPLHDCKVDSAPSLANPRRCLREGLDKSI